jgi:hypothetical protein
VKVSRPAGRPVGEEGLTNFHSTVRPAGDCHCWRWLAGSAVEIVVSFWISDSNSVLVAAGALLLLRAVPHHGAALGMHAAALGTCTGLQCTAPSKVHTATAHHSWEGCCTAPFCTQLIIRGKGAAPHLSAHSQRAHMHWPTLNQRAAVDSEITLDSGIALADALAYVMLLIFVCRWQEHNLADQFSSS